MMGRESDFGLEMPTGLEDQTTFVLSEPALDAAPEPPSNDKRAEPDDNMPEPMDDFSDREPFEDFGDAGSVGSAGSIREGSDEGGLPAVPDAFSDQGSDIGDVTATVTIAQQPRRGIETKTVDTRLLKKRKLLSQHGIEYPSLPATFVKRVAQNALQSSGLSNKRISTDTLVALTQASEWYFEQLGDDLGAYANHAKRKTIEDSDVATLMRR
jgi:histone H3/H4